MVVTVLLVIGSRTHIYSDDFSLMAFGGLQVNQEAVGLVASDQTCTIFSLEDPWFP